MTREPLFRRYLRFWRPDPRRDVDEELSFHLAMRRRDYEQSGMASSEADRATRERFGNVDAVHSEVEHLAVKRHARRRRAEWLDALRQDVRFAVRTLRAAPGYAMAVTLTLAIGIGANLAIFTVVNAVLLRPLPLREPEQVVRVFDDLKGAGATDVGMSVAELGDLTARTDLFDGVSPTMSASAALAGGEHVERIELLGTGANYFDVLGASAALGRVYHGSEWQPGFLGTAVISDPLWRRQFGADPNIIGKSVRLDEDPYIIIGVMPPEFRHPGATLSGAVDIWAGAGFSGDPFPSPPVRAQRLLPGAVARIRHGVTLRQAQARLDALAPQLARAHPNDYPSALRWSLRVEPVQAALTGNVRPTLAILLAAVSFLLLLVCVNVASLMLARSSVRMRETALRQALGASRGRIARQLLTESVVLAALGGAAALLTLRVAVRSLVAMMPPDLPRLNEVRVDWRIAIAAAGLTVVAGILIGLAPAFHATAVDPNQALKEGGRTGAAASARHNRWRSVLVVAEIALSAVLLIAAGLLVRSFGAVLHERSGISPAGVIAGQIWVPVPNNPAANKYLDPSRQAALVQTLLERLQHLPGVDRAALATIGDVPFSGGGSNSPRPFSLPDEPTTQQDNRSALFGSVSALYFATLGIPVERGRAFTDHDDRTAPIVAIVNEAFVRRFASGHDMVGRRLRIGRATDLTVVGVVADVRDAGLDVAPEPRIYTSLLQRPTVALSMFVHARGNATSAMDAMTRMVREVDPDLPVFGLRTMDDLLSSSMARRRFALSLMSAFAVAAVLLAALGIYGVMAFLVNQRRQEFGIRQALGATRMNIITLASRPGLTFAVVGAFVGVISALAVTRAMSALLFGVSAHDPATFIAVPVLLIVVAGVACLVPARRATRVDPTVALRD